MREKPEEVYLLKEIVDEIKKSHEKQEYESEAMIYALNNISEVIYELKRELSLLRGSLITS